MNLMQLLKDWQQNVDQHYGKITDIGVKSIENIPQCCYVSIIMQRCQSLKPYVFVLYASINDQNQPALRILSHRRVWKHEKFSLE